jgi:hypothetical protein
LHLAVAEGCRPQNKTSQIKAWEWRSKPKTGRYIEVLHLSPHIANGHRSILSPALSFHISLDKPNAEFIEQTKNEPKNGLESRKKPTISTLELLNKYQISPRFQEVPYQLKKSCCLGHFLHLNSRCGMDHGGCRIDRNFGFTQDPR